jgi:hypothetical protein
MDAEIKRKWVEALRSGAYEQGRGQLCKDGAYCCLGVLCVLTGLAISADGEQVVDEQGLSFGYAPVRKIAGPSLHTLWRLNDVEEKSFAEIADYIEEHL